MVAALPSEACRTVADKVVDQVSAVGTQEARVLGTVINVDLASGATPAEWALALVAPLLQWHAQAPVGAGTVPDRAGVHGDVARGAFVT